MKEKRSFMNMEVTLEEAKNNFFKLDPAQAAEKSGALYDNSKNSLTIPFVNNTFKIEHPSGKITAEDDKPASQYLAIIILHYLVTADGTALTGEWISYRHLPGGDIYMEPFRNRAIKPFLGTFGSRPGTFLKAASALGGYKPNIGGVSMVIPVLPRVPLCFVLWPGDEEIPSSANILFDEAASSYLPTEDYAHLPAIVNSMLKKQAG